MYLQDGHKYQIYAQAMDDVNLTNGGNPVAGSVEKEINGVRKEHKFIRADRHASYDDAVEFSLAKARQIVDQMGERMFS